MANLIQSSLQFPEEIWKDIEGWEGYYQISSFARVKSLERIVLQKHTIQVHVKEKFLKQSVAAQTGYLTVSFRRTAKLSKKMAIHVLVAKAFVDGYFEGAQVNHEDGNKLNNRIDNLKWGTCQYNVQHATKMGLNKTRHAYMTLAKKIVDIKTGEVYESIAEAGRKTGIKWKRISSMLCGYTKNNTNLQYLVVV